MKAKKVWFTENRINLLTADDKSGSLPIRLFSRLYNATDEQRQNFSLSNFGIHWHDIDEDLSYEGFFNEENIATEKNEIAQIFSEFSELKINQFAKSMGINASLFQQYIDGYKTPSAERKKAIEQALHRLGRELLNVTL